MDRNLIALLAMGAAAWGVDFWLKRRQLKAGYVKGAKNIQSDMQRMFSELPDTRIVSAKDFPRIPPEYYERIQHDLAQRGFRFIADVEDLSLSKQFPSMRTFIRTMLSPDGTISAGIYEIKPKGFMRILQLVGIMDRQLRGVDLDTEFDDGTFVDTCIAKKSSLLRETPGIVRTILPPGTTIDTALRSHQAAVARYASEGARPLSFSTFEEMKESGIRERKIKNAHRQATGLLTREEMRQITRPRFQETADHVMDEMEKMPPPPRPPQD